MTNYLSRGRSAQEIMVVVLGVGFLVGFVVALCYQNYARAKRAMERQRQRRLAKLLSQQPPTSSGHVMLVGGHAENTGGSPTKSTSSAGSSGGEQQYLLSSVAQTNRQRRANPPELVHDLLLQPNDSISAARPPNNVANLASV
jgi:NAD(P)H-hydrate repair Nnr-like enzyme with NAD(P)H-hydrate dehydratase domain